MQSYNNHSAWSPSQNPSSSIETHSGPPTYRHSQSDPTSGPQLHPRSLSVGTPAPPPRPPLPPSLTPGGRQRGQSVTSNSADLFFEQRSDYGFPRRTSDASSNPLYTNNRPRYTQSYTAGTVVGPKPPPLPRKPMSMSQIQSATSAPPPIPPKPSSSPPPTIPPKIPLYPQSNPGPGIHSPPLESMLVRPPPPLPPPPPPLPANSQVSPPGKKKGPPLRLASSTSDVTGRKQDQLNQEDEELAMALEESRLMASLQKFNMSSSDRLEDVPPDTQSVPSHVHSLPTSPMQSVDLPENNNWFSTSSHVPQSVNEQPSSPQEVHTSRSPLPLYSEVFSVDTTPSALRPGRSSSASAHVPGDQASSSRPISIPEAPLSSRRDSITSASSQHSGASEACSQSLPSSGPIPSSSHGVKPVTGEGSSASVSSKSSANSQPLSSMPSLSTDVSNDEEQGQNPNHFVERELLDGVSLSFAAPVISTTLKPMAGPMPNIITLPYGKSPPLHLQAPGWRHLLKLMARLSGTRIEPTLEAMSITKGDLKLRTVVQFVRTHHLSSEWRVILYLTIDHPVPSNAQNEWKYSNGDVSTLPWSYTLSNIPALLRDGADTPTTTYYTIPSTAKTPYPVLPIDLPNLAMYLQSALQDSRRAMNDASSGLRKLAKCVESCYVNEHEDTGDDEVSDRSLGGVLKKVIRRGNRQSRWNKSGNEEVYELVTPFMANEWG